MTLSENWLFDTEGETNPFTIWIHLLLFIRKDSVHSRKHKQFCPLLQYVIST